jgi:hypothetical protein
MKRILLGLTSVLSFAVLAVSVPAAEAVDCSVVNTGPNSSNSCTATSNNNVKVTCNNNTDVVFVNGQSSNSGNVTLTNNTNGGTAVSGGASNVNTVNGKLDVSCGTKTAAAPAPAPTPSPAPAGGQGAATPTPAPTAAPKAASLPNTGSNSVVTGSAIVAAVLGLAAVATRFGLVVYRHFSLK